MKTQRLLTVLTVVNFGLLVHLLLGPNSAGADNNLSVLKGSGLQIVDAEGRVRASLGIMSADPGNGEAETVLFRLIDGNGQPSVKIATSNTVAGMSLVGGDDESYIILSADGPHSSLKIVGPGGGEQFAAP